MKKRNLTSLKLKKTIISTFDKEKVKGGLPHSVIVFSFCCSGDKH